MQYYPIIDGDILVYRCGFAAQRKEYAVYSVDGNEVARHRYKKDLDEWIKEYGEVWRFETETKIEPLENALNNVRTVLVAILDRLGTNEEGNYKIYLTGKDNYREQVAVTRGYKANRNPDHKPAWYNEIKDYLIQVWGAEVIDGQEADDAIAKLQMSDSFEYLGIAETTQPCIVSTDKDLDQIPGFHYNWVKDELYEIDPMQASHYFWVQMISGDATDNIQGIPGMGEKKAIKYLDQYDPFEWEDAVRELYDENYTLGKEVFEEHFKLVKIGGDYNNNAEEKVANSTKD